MSHELRTPLNAIIGFSDVMRNEMLGPLPPRYVEYATDIHRSGQHLLHLIDDVLNMARIDSGGMQLDLSPVDLQPVPGLVDVFADPQGDKLRSVNPQLQRRHEWAAYEYLFAGPRPGALCEG